MTDGEQVLLRTRPHPRALALPVLALVVVLAVAGFAAARLPDGTSQPSGRAAVAGVAALLLLRWVVVPWLRWLSTVLVVTERSLRVEQGVLRRTSRGVPLSRVADVAVERTVGQRLVGSGTLVLDTVGERGGVVVRDVPHVRDVARQLTGLVQTADSADDD